MRLLQRLRHHAHLPHDVILVQPRAVQPRRLDIPRRALRRDLPGVALVLDHLLRPALADDVEVLLESRAVGRVDRVMLARPRPVHAVNLLRQRIHPAPLIPARETRQCPPARHMVEHRDILRHPNRVMRRQHHAQLPHPNPLRLHRQIQVEHDRIRRELEALDMEMVLGETDRVVTERVARLGELAQIREHLLVQLGPQPRHPLLDVLARPHRREEEEGNLHDALLSAAQPPVRSSRQTVQPVRPFRKSSTARLKSGGLSMFAACPALAITAFVELAILL